MHVGVGAHEGNDLAVIGKNAFQDRGALGGTTELQRLGGVEQFNGQHGFHIVHNAHQFGGAVGAHGAES